MGSWWGRRKLDEPLSNDELRAVLMQPDGTQASLQIDHNEKQINIAEVERYECIGQGRNGQVFRAKWSENIVALKFVSLTPTTTDTLADGDDA